MQPWHAVAWDEANMLLGAAMQEGMRLQPFPYVLHRTPVRDVVLRQRPKPRDERDAQPVESELAVEAGKRVVLGIVSGAHDTTKRETGEMSTLDMLFGGAYRPAYGEPDANRYASRAGIHACPGQAIGLGTTAGVLTALLRAGNLSPLAPLKLELEPFADRRRVPAPPTSPEAPVAGDEA